MAIDHLKDLGLPIYLHQGIRVNSARVVAEGVFRPVITEKKLSEALTEITGMDSEEFTLPTKVFELDLREGDSVVLRALENGLPLMVYRNGEVIVNFDIQATQTFSFVDSKRPIYTYIPGFHIQMIPPFIRRPLSTFVHSVFSKKGGDIVRDYSNLPLTSFEFVILLLSKVLARNHICDARIFHWPSGKRAVFVSLHDVDTGGFLRRKERDSLFRLEQKHQIRSTWFVPTIHLKGKETVDFLLQSGNEVGWHGYNHDHRLPFQPFTDQRVNLLKNSILSDPGNYPTGMRSPRLLVSNHLYDLLDRNCPALCYDTSFSRGIAPYYLWVNGRKKHILEIPITVPTAIGIYQRVQGLPRSRKFKAILDAQIARTKKLIDVSGIISIVTHPEMDLTERPEFLDVYDQYLSYIKSCPDIWFTTAGELFKYWIGDGRFSAKHSQ